MPLHSLKPVDSLLSLTAEDKFLEKGLEEVSIPPRDLEERCLLAHCGIRQAAYAGTHLLDHLFRNPPGESPHLAPLLLYRHVIDLGDSIGTLLRFGASSTAAILVRALYEGILGLDFMLQGNIFHHDRAACYWAFYRINQLRNFTRYDPATEQGKEFHKILDADQMLKSVNFPRRDHSKERKEIVQMLNSKDYKPFWDKYQLSKKKPKHWYSLCSDKSDLRGLAKLIGHEAEYLLLYRMLSETAHASDVISGVLECSPGKGIQVHQIRGPEEKIQEAASLAANYLLGCHQLVLNTYYPRNHDLQKWFARWYAKEYRPFFLWVTGPGTPAVFDQDKPNSPSPAKPASLGKDGNT